MQPPRQMGWSSQATQGPTGGLARQRESPGASAQVAPIPLSTRSGAAKEQGEARPSASIANKSLPPRTTPQAESSEKFGFETLIDQKGYQGTVPPEAQTRLGLHLQGPGPDLRQEFGFRRKARVLRGPSPDRFEPQPLPLRHPHTGEGGAKLLHCARGGQKGL